MTEEARKGEKPVSKRKRHPLILDVFLILSFLVILLFSASYWYVKQPEPRRKQICEEVGTWVDKSARPVGELVDRIVTQFRLEDEQTPP